MKKTVLMVIVTLCLGISSSFAEIVMVTNDDYYNSRPFVAENGDIFWCQNRPTQQTMWNRYLMYYNGSNIYEVEYIGSGNCPSGDPSTFSKGQLVYAKMVNDIQQIFVTNGKDVNQISNSVSSVNNDANINSGFIVWSAADSNGRDKIFLYKPEPTVIGLSTLEAVPSNSKITVKWKTETEIDNIGFNVWRSGKYKKINKKLIPAKGSATNGAEYQFQDKNVSSKKEYDYILEDIDMKSGSTLHGPVSSSITGKRRSDGN